MPTHLYYGADELTDEMVVDHGLRHLRNDNARLLRVHLQHICNARRGLGDTTNPKPEYIQYFVKTVDPLLAELMAGLRRTSARGPLSPSDHELLSRPAAAPRTSRSEVPKNLGRVTGVFLENILQGLPT